MDNIKLVVNENQHGMRLDAFIVEEIDNHSRSKIKNMVEKGQITLNGKETKVSKSVNSGDVVEIIQSDVEEADILPEDIDFEIVYQDEDFAVINKPQGLIVHPTQALRTGTLVNGLMKRLDNLSGINGVMRPGIVHRIDKDTSGLLVVAKNDLAHNSLAEQIQFKTAKRSYLCLVEGEFKEDNGRITTMLGRNPKDRKSMAVVKRNGKEAITDYIVEERFEKFTLVRFNLHTGRTHQIRVHAKYMGHPVVGDPVYGYLKQKFKLKGQLLHAEQLELDHPRTGERMVFNAKLPDYFENVLNELRAIRDGE